MATRQDRVASVSSATSPIGTSETRGLGVEFTSRLSELHFLDDTVDEAYEVRRESTLLVNRFLDA